MTTRKKSSARKFLEELLEGPLTLSDLILSIRLGEEMTQVEFAKKLGVSKAHLCDIEKGRRAISPERASRFAKKLGYSESQFIELAFQDQLGKLDQSYVVNVHKRKKAA